MPLPARARHRDASRARVRLPATVVLSAEGEDRQEGVREGQRACSSQARQLHGEVEGTPARARECPCVTRVYTEDNAACGFAGISAKPSDGLEPSTPSLPWRLRAGGGRVSLARSTCRSPCKSRGSSGQWRASRRAPNRPDRPGTCPQDLSPSCRLLVDRRSCWHGAVDAMA